MNTSEYATNTIANQAALPMKHGGNLAISSSKMPVFRVGCTSASLPDSLMPCMVKTSLCQINANAYDRNDFPSQVS